MSRAVVHKRRQLTRIARRRRKDTLLASLSVLVHLTVFLLLPGLVAQADQPQTLLIEIALPASSASLESARSSGPRSAIASIPPQASPESRVMSEITPAADRESSVAEVAEPEGAQPAGTVEPTEPGIAASVSDGAPDEPQSPTRDNEATAISSMRPVAVPAEDSETQISPAPPDVQQAAGELQTAGESSEAMQSPGDRSGEPSAESQLQAGEEQADGASTDAGAATDTEESGPLTSTSDDQGDAGESVDGSPPGPSAHELELLGEYADAARRRIRSQARNPEQGGGGVVSFEFEVAHDGHLIDVRVIRSSGYSNVDNDAIEATRAAFNERHEKLSFPAEVTVASWVFVMSLEYPLY